MNLYTISLNLDLNTRVTNMICINQVITNQSRKITNSMITNLYSMITNLYSMITNLKPITCINIGLIIIKIMFLNMNLTILQNMSVILHHHKAIIQNQHINQIMTLPTTYLKGENHSTRTRIPYLLDMKVKSCQNTGIKTLMTWFDPL